MAVLSGTEVLIIGAGVVGAAIARELSRYQLQVLLVDRECDVCFGTSKANSGIVHSGIHDKPDTLKSRFCVAGNKLYPNLVEELDVLYQRNGSLIVAQQDNQLPLLKELQQQGIANGIADTVLLDNAELTRLEPNLNPSTTGGLLVPSAGIVAPFDLTFALVENAVMNGVKLQLDTEVNAIQPEATHFLVTTNHGLIRTKYILNTAGIYSGKIAGLIGDESFTITPKKGEEYLLDRKVAGVVSRTIFPLPGKDSKGILVIPTVDGNIMIGPTARQAESFSDLSTSNTGWQEIYREVNALIPLISSHDLIASFAGLRAISNQEDFIITPSVVNPKFIHVAGIQSPGLTAAPAIAKYVTELLKENGLKLKPKPGFNPLRRLVRLRQLNHEQQAELISKEPAYGNIICRCELVSEAEVRAAIRRGAATLDGVKLRTRTGMGRCQGGFCTPKLIQLLSDELGIAPENVTKKGLGSFLLKGRLRP